MTEMNEQTVRAEARTWLEANWDTDLGLVEWRNKLVDSGWGAPHWPSSWYGRDLPVGLVPVVDEEFDRMVLSVSRRWESGPWLRRQSCSRHGYA